MSGGTLCRLGRVHLAHTVRMEFLGRDTDAPLSRCVLLEYDRSMKEWALWVAAAIAVRSTATHAHHSISSVYDSSRQVTIEGIVAEFQLVNPHPFLIIDVKGRTGEAQRWQLEMDNRRELVSIGVTASTFKRGDLVVVTGDLARRSGQQVCLLRLDRRADGFVVRAGRLEPENSHSS